MPWVVMLIFSAEVQHAVIIVDSWLRPQDKVLIPGGLDGF